MTTTTTTTTVDRLRDGGYVRRCNEHTSDGSWLVVFLANRDDTSPAHSMMTYGLERGYDRRCSYCWAGTNHSEEAHALKVAAAERSWHR